MGVECSVPRGLGTARAVLETAEDPGRDALRAASLLVLVVDAKLLRDLVAEPGREHGKHEREECTGTRDTREGARQAREVGANQAEAQVLGAVGGAHGAAVARVRVLTRAKHPRVVRVKDARAPSRHAAKV